MWLNTKTRLTEVFKVNYENQQGRITAGGSLQNMRDQEKKRYTSWYENHLT
jgi:hypothetical protein